MRDLIPAPVSVAPDPGRTFTLTATTRIVAPDDAVTVGEYLADALRPATGFAFPLHDGSSSDGPADGAIVLRLDPDHAADEAYRLTVQPLGVRLVAGSPAGLFAGVQTLLQLLPVDIDGREPHPGPWEIGGGEVIDRPRFAHRAAMLDVSRHFFTVGEVKRFIDEIARFKLNVLHLHLTDDQGWRIEIRSWPRLATVGGASQIGGPGGFFTQAQYRDLVSYAAARHITVIPEIDMPGHTNAALVSYPELNPDGVAPDPFLRSGSAVGFSSLWTDSELTYRFVDDVLGEVAALTPGPYLHLGTDEAHATTANGYLAFVNRALATVDRLGKRAIGWHEVLRANPPASVVAQYWGRTEDDEAVRDAAARGNRIVLSPATKAYLDMKYTTETPIGFKWAAYIDVADAYGWDPGSYLNGVPESAVLGVEAPLWTETVTTYDEVEYMAFPRLAAIAELGWSPASAHDFPDFARRLSTYGPRWSARGVNFYRSTQIPWPV